jgi:hypothetical protein
MPNYTPRKSSSASNLPMIAAAGFVGFGVLAVAGVIVYHKLTARGEPEVVASVPAADGTGQKASKEASEVPIPPEVSSQVQSAKSNPATPPTKSAPTPPATGNNSPRTTKTKEPPPDDRWKVEARLEYLDALKEQERRMSAQAIQIGSLSQAELKVAERSLKQLLDNGLDKTPKVVVDKAAKIATRYVEALRREQLVKSPRYAQMVASGEAPARYPAEKRKALYDQISSVVGFEGKWTLTMLFDDLNQSDMDTALEAAMTYQRGGMGRLTRDQRLILLRAGALDLFRRELGY